MNISTTMKKAVIISAIILLALCAAVLLIVFYLQSRPQPIYGYINDFGTWEDTRLRNDVHFQYHTNRIPVWEDEYLEPNERYSFLKVGELEFASYYSELTSTDSIGEKLCDTVAYDYAQDENHVPFVEGTIDCEVYAIDGITTEFITAVRFPDDDRFFLYYNHLYSRSSYPETLGEFLDSFSPQKYLSLTEYTSYERENSTGRYMLSEEGNRRIWEVFTEYRDVECKNTGSFVTDNYVTFKAKVNEYGVSNNAFSIHESGSVWTNAANYHGFYFYIGEEGAARIMSIIEECTVHDASDMRDNYSIIGEVTEIGDGYFKIDDSICMKNPDEGVIITVKTDDIKVMRYFLSERIKIGYLVIVEYDGVIDLETYTVNNPLNITTGIRIIEGDHDIILE